MLANKKLERAYINFVPSYFNNLGHKRKSKNIEKYRKHRKPKITNRENGLKHKKG